MRHPTFEELNPDWYRWRPTPSFKQFDDRWQGYHDPATGTRLPYNQPKHQPDHFHGAEKFDARCGRCIDLRSR